MTTEPVDVIWELAAPEDGALVAHVAAITEVLRAAVNVAEREICVVLVDDADIEALNLKWRDVDGPTDVLSFPVEAGPQGPPGPLGDIVISLETSGRQAAGHGWSLHEELTFLLVHSVCHLMGHDHGEPGEAAKMRAEEDRLLAIAAPGQARPPTPY
jgi:probable rRNA maturation factor